jgi:hypothetical protein
MKTRRAVIGGDIFAVALLIGTAVARAILPWLPQQQREIHARLKVGEPQDNIARSYNVDVGHDQTAGALADSFIGRIAIGTHRAGHELLGQKVLPGFRSRTWSKARSSAIPACSTMRGSITTTSTSGNG